MEILVGEKAAEEYFEEAKNELEKGELTIIGKGRDTVKAVDLAELLKIHGAKVEKIEIDTEEKEVDEKTQRTSVIKIKIKKE